MGTLTVRSTGGDITLQRNVNVLNHVEMYSGNIYARANKAVVWATGAGSDVFMQARNSLVVQGTYGTNEIAVVRADRLVHPVAGDITLDGVVQVSNTATGRILANAGNTLTIGGAGSIKSAKDIDLNAGADLSWNRADLEASIAREKLQGGQLVLRGQAMLQADGNVALRSGGDVTIDADANVTGVRDVTVREYTTKAVTIDVVKGYRRWPRAPCRCRRSATRRPRSPSRWAPSWSRSARSSRS
ncbi:hypothetical protein HK414_16015 [Ramlibacter terrae]|uniref:Uncharacterized protein n=1 Tax=Ramlibacter terrae TaxID=2732511 RepID=A0ABX6P5K1_9BURK|nr:hypothetical protein HK414_16015 [Ramlibacter terrae]